MIECRTADQGDEAPPPPPNLVEAIATMLTGRDEQTVVLRQLIQQGALQRQGNHNHQEPHVPGYQEFLGTQPPLFS